MSAPHEPRLLTAFTIPGEAAGKKNSQRITFPGIMSLGLRKPGGKGLVMGVTGLLEEIGRLATFRPQEAGALARRAAVLCKPVVLPSKEHEAWHKVAIKAIEQVPGARPLLPEGHLGRIQTVVYLGKGQTGDLVNFEQAVWDLMQDAGLITTDHWINSQDGSERRWDDPSTPRIEVELWDLGAKLGCVLPTVRVEGLLAAKEQLGPLDFAVVAPDGRRIELVTLPRGSSRDRVVVEAGRIWRIKHGEMLRPGSVILCGEKRTEPAQASLLEAAR